MTRTVEIFLPCVLRGGTEQSTLMLAQVLVQGGYCVAVTCAYESDSTMVEAFSEVGVRVRLLQRRRPGTRTAAVGEWLALASKLWRTWRRQRPDIVHVQYITPGLVPILAARMAGVPLVMATVHQSGRPYGIVPHLLIRVAAALCRRFLCVSGAVQTSWFGERPVFLYERARSRARRLTVWNAVDQTAMEVRAGHTDTIELRRKIGIRLGVPVVTFLGRLHPIKGVDQFLPVLGKLAEQNVEFAFVIAGDGPQRESLRRQANDLGLAERCRWMGSVAPKDVPHILAASDLVVVPSRAEGFGLTAVEAMACGKAVAAADIDGLREVIESGVSGELIDVGEAESSAAILRTLLCNPRRRSRLGQAAARRVKERFGIERFRKQILGLYALEFEALRVSRTEKNWAPGILSSGRSCDSQDVLPLDRGA